LISSISSMKLPNLASPKQRDFASTSKLVAVPSVSRAVTFTFRSRFLPYGQFFDLLEGRRHLRHAQISREVDPPFPAELFPFYLVA